MNKQQLLTAVAQFAHRENDADFASKLDSLILLAESRMNKELKCFYNVQTKTITINEQGQTLTDLPLDVISVIRANASGQSLSFIDQCSYELAVMHQNDIGTPQVFALNSDQLFLAPYQDCTIKIKAVYPLPSLTLTADNETTALLAGNAGIYLNAILIEAFKMLVDIDGLQQATQDYNAAKQDLNRQYLQSLSAR